ncbi:MAG TPA: 16S rRNA (uracil(1498)-N(3))-methyltransferase [Perlabentimonas sp.]|nr:16S rRNA (uracil(1498)-N(3))-methyltransferase [Bacteroidales bacterium]MDY0349410.1 16S rRNA (uracil(1498)-N(3))-methyltransferase [Tenuifilaceae bacterium]HZJ74025.1 16S rRNA (uracil(1498)-N(3))-methyltransferase [Perlabentimonas sp.]
MHIFYIPQIDGNSIVLPEDESKHCVRVLRLNTGDTINIVNGKGNMLTCSITDPHPKRCTVEVIETQHKFGKRTFRLHIAIAPTKNIERFEWFLEKATEIGIDEITPILCKHSERKTIKHERLERVIVAAMKQSIKAYKPTLNALTPLKNAIQQDPHSTRLMAYCGDFNEPHAKSLINQNDNIFILIGPEGDFSPNEVEMALKAGFNTTGLGSSRLRTETAGVVACTIANLINQ